MVNGSDFSTPILILFCHQSVLDACLCLATGIQILLPVMWGTGNFYVDTLICHLWHSVFLWGAILTSSIWNLVCIAFERYCAICHPFHYQNITTKKLQILLFVVHMCSLSIMASPLTFFVSMRNGTCHQVYVISVEAGKLFSFFFAIFQFFVLYVIPCILFLFLYGSVVQTFYKRKKAENLASSRIIDKASSELTKTAITVTIIFCITMSFEQWYYVLASTGVLVFNINGILQKVGLWVMSFNSAANPFVYALLIPLYRRSVVKTFCCK